LGLICGANGSTIKRDIINSRNLGAEQTRPGRHRQGGNRQPSPILCPGIPIADRAFERLKRQRQTYIDDYFSLGEGIMGTVPTSVSGRQARCAKTRCTIELTGKLTGLIRAFARKPAVADA